MKTFAGTLSTANASLSLENQRVFVWCYSDQLCVETAIEGLFLDLSRHVLNDKSEKNRGISSLRVIQDVNQAN